MKDFGVSKACSAIQQAKIKCMEEMKRLDNKGKDYSQESHVYQLLTECYMMLSRYAN